MTRNRGKRAVRPAASDDDELTTNLAIETGEYFRRKDPEVVRVKVVELVSHMNRSRRDLMVLVALFSKFSPGVTMKGDSTTTPAVVFKLLLNEFNVKWNYTAQQIWDATPDTVFSVYEYFTQQIWTTVGRMVGNLARHKERYSQQRETPTELIKDYDRRATELDREFAAAITLGDMAAVQAVAARQTILREERNADRYTWDWLDTDEYNGVRIEMFDNYDLKAVWDATSDNTAMRNMLVSKLDIFITFMRAASSTILDTPDFNSHAAASKMLNSLLALRSHPRLTDCREAFNDLEGRLAEFEANMGKYYRTAVVTNNGASPMMSFIDDASQKVPNGSVRRQYMRIMAVAQEELNKQKGSSRMGRIVDGLMQRGNIAD